MTDRSWHSRQLVVSICVLVLTLSGLCRANDDLLAEALEELQVGEYDNAQKWFEKLLQESSSDAKFAVPAYIGLSRVYSEQGEYSKAIQHLQQGLQSHGDEAKLWSKLAEVQFYTGDFEQSQQSVEKALDLDSQNLKAILIKAHVLTEKGQIDDALAEYRSFVRIYNRLQPTDAETLVTIGEGAAVYARWESVSPIFRFLVNTLCPDALKDDANYWQAYVLSGSLLLEKYNEGQALPELNSAIEINPYCADALVAMAIASLQDSKFELADEFAERALKPNPNHIDAIIVKAFVQLLSEDEDAGRLLVERALQINPRHQEALGLQAAIHVLEHGENPAHSYEVILDAATPQETNNELSEFQRIWAELVARNPKPGVFLETVGAVLDARRKYDHAEVFYRKAIELMPQLSAPKTALGMLYMRSGKIDQAEAILDTAFEADPFHVRVSNMRKVLDVLKSYNAVETDHFIVRAAKADHLLAKMTSDYLEEIYPELTERYDFEPFPRSQFEIYSTTKDQSGHAWFSARMIGLPWIQTVGASTGRIVAMTSPGEAEKQFNWMRVIRHEFVHVITLQKTGFNIPHWFTEAISVTEENMEIPVEWQLLLLKRHDRKTLFNLLNINNGFQKPKDADDWTLAYCQSYLYAQHMHKTFGDEALRKLLDAYCITSDTREAVRQAFGISIEELEKGYQAHIEDILRSVRRKKSPDRLSFREAQALVEQSPEDSAAYSQLALALIPQVGYQDVTVQALDKALDIDASDALAVALKANMHLQNDSTDEALELLKQASVGSTQEPIFLRVQAAAYRQAEKTDDAIEVLNYAIKRFPLETVFYEQLLDVYDETKVDSAQLKELLEVLAARDYDDVPSRKRLARLAAGGDDPRETIRWAREALAVDVRDPEMHQILAEAYVAANRKTDAINAYENLMLLDKVSPETQFAYAKLLREDKQFERAASVLRQFLNTDPDNTEAKALLKLVEKGI